MAEVNKENYVTADRYNRIQGAVIKTQQRNYSVYKGVNTIGRNKTAIINLKNLNVSQNHALIIIVDDTQHFISDLNSSNGTYLLGTKLSPYKLYELINDVEIKFGDVVTSYFKVSNTDTTLHLEMESVNMTQNMTQNFYGSATQLIINESSLNQTNSNTTPRRLNPELEDIHELETQVVIRPPIITDKLENLGTITTNDSDIISEIYIHEAPTQIVDYQPPTTSIAIRDGLDAVKTQSNLLHINSPQGVDKVEEQQEVNIHEMPTQVVNLPQEPDSPEQQEADVHEMQTQVVNLPQELDRPEEQEADVHEMQTQVVDVHHRLNELREEDNDSSTQIDEDKEKLSQKDKEMNESFVQIQKMSNIKAVEETIIEETVIEESCTEKDVEEDSNDSIDFLTVHKPLGNELAASNKEANDGGSTFSSSQDIGVPKKRPTRKLSSSEDLSQTHNNKAIYNSDSDTDIEGEITAQNNRNLLTKTVDSGSDTEIEDGFLEQSKKKSKVLNSDSETDIEERISYKEVLTQSQDIKPKILNKKRVLDSDSETDIEDNKENDLVLKQAQEDNSTDTEILNDTDCIPATQDAFADMFEYKGSKLATSNVNSQNASSEESFKLGLTELMVESIEDKMEENEPDKVINEENTNNADVVDSGNVEQLENNKEHGCIDLNVRDEKDPPPKLIENEANEDLYMMPTQKVCSDVPKEEHNKEDTHDEIVQKYNENENKPSTIPDIGNAAETLNDDIYIMPTQKLNEKQIDNEQRSTPSTSKEDKIEEPDEDFYIMPTQNLNENNGEPIFKTPQKKFNFKKKKVKNQYDPYSEPTQKITEEEDFYLLPTQKLGEEQMQNSSGIETTTKTTGKNDEALYLAETQPINSNLTERKINKDSLCKSVTDVYLQKTQDICSENLGINRNDNSENPNTIPTQQISHDIVEGNSGVIKDSLKKSVSDLYLQETEDICLKNLETKRNENNEDPYMMPTQQINQDLVEDHGFIKDNFKTLTPQNIIVTKATVHFDEKVSKSKNINVMPPISSSIMEKETNMDSLKKSVTDLYLQETQDIGQQNLETNKSGNNEDPYMMSTQQIHHNLEENRGVIKDNSKTSASSDAILAKTPVGGIRSGVKRQVQSNLNTSKPEKMRKITDIETETLSQIDAFVKQPLTTLKEENEGSSHKISKNNDKIELDQSETLSQIQKFVVETSDNSKKPKIKTLPKKRGSLHNPKKETVLVTQEEDKSETLSQIEAFIKKPLSTVKIKNVTLSKLKETEDLSDKIEQSNEVFEKPESKTHVSKEECGIFDKSDDLNTSSDKSTALSHVEQVEKSFALLEAKSTKTRKSQRLTTSAEVKVALCKNRRSMATSAVPESSSSITELKPATRKSRKKSTNINNNDIPTISDNAVSKINVRSKRKLEPMKKEINTDVCESEKPNKMPKINKSKGKQKEETSTIAEPLPTTSNIKASINTKPSLRNKQKAEIDTPIEISSPSTSKAKPSSYASKKSSASGSFEEESNNSTDSALSTPSRRGRRNVPSTPVLTSPEKGKRKQKPKVVFTMLDDPLLESSIRQLGGSVVDSVESSTVLITEHVKRSQKLLTAVGLGKPICSPEWIRASKKANTFLDPWDYILLDEEAESKWDFSLRESLTRASKEKLLSDYTFLLIVNNAADVLKGAIEACGGKCVPKYQAKNSGFFIVISTQENKTKYSKVKKQHPEVTVIEPEAIFDGVLRQDLRLGNHLLTK